METERMLLRAFTLDDVDALVALDSDLEVRRYVEDGRPVNRAEAIDTIEHWHRAYPSPDTGFWAATERTTGSFLGWFHLRPPPGSPVDEPELGYRLVRSAWGRGYGTEGARALIDHAFTRCGASRVVAETMAVNIGSRRVMEKAGMRLVRSFVADWPVRIEGDEHGDVEYAITRTEWAERPDSP